MFYIVCIVYMYICPIYTIYRFVYKIYDMYYYIYVCVYVCIILCVKKSTQKIFSFPVTFKILAFPG